MNHGSLFSGIGGFDLAAEWMGWQNIFHCEINAFCQKVLKYHFPHAATYTDIKQTDFTIHRGNIDILTGGFPCQPYSLAGKRKGKEDERHLWPEMLRAIREIQPRWVVGENVFGLVNWSGGLVFHEVQANLEAEGYEVQPYVLPACAKDAPHRRDRIWFVAYAGNIRCNDRSDNRQERHIQGNERIAEENKSERNRWKCRVSKVGSIPTNANGNGFIGSNSEHEINTSEGRLNALRNIEPVCEHAANTGLQGSKINGSITGIRQNGNEQPAGLFQSAWEKFPTQSPLCGRNDGLSGKLDNITFPKWRAESIKAYGNAIVPQVAFEIFKAIEQYELL
jgi:DNA (cytosine-5)-methyltransferase 1